TPSSTGIPTPSPSVTSSPEPGNTPAPSPSEQAVEKEKKIRLINGYLQTPSTSFLLIKPFELETKLLFNELPSNNQSAMIFTLYNENNTQQVFYSLSVSGNNKLLLTVNTETGNKTETVNISTIQLNTDYNLRFVDDGQKISIFINNEAIFTKSFPEPRLASQSGQAILNFGADKAGDKLLKATI